MLLDVPIKGHRSCRLLRQIQEILDEQVNPAVASHGGVITLLEYKDGVAYMKMGGGCASIARTCVGEVWVRNSTSSGPGGGSLPGPRLAG